MKIPALALLTALVAIGGTFAANPGDSAKALRATVGVTAYAFAILVISHVDDGLATALAVLVLIAVLFRYGEPIAKKLKFLEG